MLGAAERLMEPRRGIRTDGQEPVSQASLAHMADPVQALANGDGHGRRLRLAGQRGEFLDKLVSLRVLNVEAHDLPFYRINSTTVPVPPAASCCFAVTKQRVGAGRQWYFHRLAAKVKEQNLAVFGESGTADAAALIRHISPGRPVTLGGQSVGGHTALLTAASRSELVARLVLLETTVAGGTDPKRLGDWFRPWPLPFASAEVAHGFLGDDALARSWITHLEPAPEGGLLPPFQADVMEAIMASVSEPCWPQWQSVRAPTTAVFAANGTFSASEQAAFIAARPGTRHMVLTGGSHDAHLDATAEGAAALRSVLAAPAEP